MKLKEEYHRELLSTEWVTFRKNIIQRDHHQCAICKNQKYLYTGSVIANFSVGNIIYGNRPSHAMYSQGVNITPP